MTEVILIAACSLDGRITRGATEGNAFVSDADRAWFQRTLASMDAVLMGRGTYEAVRPRLLARKDDARVPRIVFTRRPDDFAADAGPGLRFTAAAPAAALRALAEEKRHRLALVGGAELHRVFLEAGLVDELWLTLEPWIFGAGKLLAPAAPETCCTLLGTEQLGSDTLLLRYRVKRRGASPTESSLKD